MIGRKYYRTQIAAAPACHKGVAVLHSLEFWSITAISALVGGFLLATIIIMTNFDALHMRDCPRASNINVYLMFNIFLFCYFSGILAIGEAFNFFDNKNRGGQHNSGFLLLCVAMTLAPGGIGLAMLRSAC